MSLTFDQHQTAVGASKVARPITMILILAALMALAALASLRIGSLPLSTGTVVESLVAYDGSDEHLVVRTLRLPRVLLAIMAGAALAVAGALMQAVTRNPLASPTIFGLNAGAAFAVVTLSFVAGLTSPLLLVLAAFAGAIGAVTLTYLIGSAGHGATPVKLALAGTVVGILLSAWVSGILIFDQQTLDEVRFWLAGSIAGQSLDASLVTLPFLLLGLVLAIAISHQVNALNLGEEVAIALGQNTARIRLLATLATVLLCGAAVAAVGPIAFVGLAVPHLVRLLIGPDYRWIMPGCLLGGPALLLAADTLGRVVVSPGELQAGIVTALIGAPVLILVVRRHKVMQL
ncbi:FecCD family ABC transporter permease [Marinobacter sp. NSM]|uniref:FecCD family ABC transporter permease n=1 Tax=Marinobacter sp. NSM TaxID=3458004 RepID=UPI004035F18A